MSGGGYSVSGASASCTHAPSLKRKSPGMPAPKSPRITTTSSTLAATPPPPTPPSCAHGVVAALERSFLRTLAFVLNHLDRAQARYCASAIVRCYCRLHARLPLFAADPLEQCASSLVALSDAEFTAFWLSLVATDEEGRHSTDLDAMELEAYCVPSPAFDVDVYNAQGKPRDDEALITRLYHQIVRRVQRLFRIEVSESHSEQCPWHVQTPPTSPDDKYDESNPRRRTCPRSRFGTDHSVDLAICGEDAATGDAAVVSDSLRVAHIEPGWAMQYMEQESRVPSAMTQRMQKMMHSKIPLNLFRVAVMYPETGSEREDQAKEAIARLVGMITPESFPPTPITRDLQTRRVHHYTVTVLDHATLALRLLETNCNA